MPNGPWKRPADDGEAIVFALKHPVRRKLLRVYVEGIHSPTHLARRLGEELHLVAYHSRALNFFGLIELVETKPSRGSTQHFYGATDLGRRALELGERTGMIEGGEAQPG